MMLKIGQQVSTPWGTGVVAYKRGELQVEFEDGSGCHIADAAPIDPTACRKCGGTMLPGIAMQSTVVGFPEWPGDSIMTLSPGGPGRLIDVLKCERCGWSVCKPITT